VKKSKKILITTAIMLVCLGAGFIVWAFVSGNARLEIGDETGQRGVGTIVCDDEIIQQYNEAVVGEVDDNYTSNIQKIVQQVEGKSGQNEDPNCAFMRLRYYLLSEDIDKASAALDDLKKISESGRYLSPLISAPASIQELEGQLEALKNNNEPPTSEDTEVEVIG